MTSVTPGRFSKAPRSTVPRLPVIPIAVRCAPGMGCAWSPRVSTAATTRRMSSGEAAESITISMRVLSFDRLRAYQTGPDGPQEVADREEEPVFRPRRTARALPRGVRLRHQAQGRLADLRPHEIHGERRPRDHHPGKRHGHGDEAR